MQKLSILEFRDLCNNMPQCCYIYDSINQDWNTVGDTMKIKQNFDGIKINFNPNTICLISSFGRLIFERVKYIRIEEPSILGLVFTVVCGDFSTNDNNKSYTIIAA